VWQKCGNEGYPTRGWMWLEIWAKLLQTEIRDSAPSNRNCWRAPLERCRNAGEKKDPRVFFICTVLRTQIPKMGQCCRYAIQTQSECSCSGVAACGHVLNQFPMSMISMR
jgi:hypothetical protein